MPSAGDGPGTGHAPAAWRRATCQCRHATEFLLNDLFFLGRRTNRRHADRASILLGLAAPGCSSHAACRCGRLPAKRAPPKGPGSSPRQRFDHRRRQPDRDQSRDAHAGLPRKLDLDRRCRRTPGVISGRRDQNLSETIADPKLPAPAINLARANLCPTSDFRDYGARRQALGNNRSFLLSAPTPPPFWASYDLNPRHRTVPNTSANTITCTGAYQPDPPQLGKAAITAGIRAIIR